MNSLQERIAQYQKMATDDPGNELAHFRLGSLYLEAGQYEDAARSFRRTLEIEPQFSRVYQLLGKALLQLGRRDEAIETLRKGFEVADERGDNLPRDEIAKMLVELGQPKPEPKQRAGSVSDWRAGSVSDRSDTGFRCARPTCPAGRYARRLPKPPFNDELGREIYERVCADCWNFWLRDFSIKVINEMRLDLSTERGQEVYDQILRETLGLS